MRGNEMNRGSYRLIPSAVGAVFREARKFGTYLCLLQLPKLIHDLGQ